MSTVLRGLSLLTDNSWMEIGENAPGYMYMNTIVCVQIKPFIHIMAKQQNERDF